MEQLWYESRYNSVAIDEVYDLILRNDDETPITGLWILYPHDLSQFGNTILPLAEILIIQPDYPSQYSWYLVDEPLWVDEPQQKVRISIPSESYDLGSRAQSAQVDCVRLMGRVTWPASIAGDEARLQVIRRLKKSLFRVEFDLPLKPQQEGILRLRITPTLSQIDSADVRAFPNPSGAPAHRFSWELRIDSPELVRAKTKFAFDNLEKLRTDEAAFSQLEHVRATFREIIRHQCDGCSVRIESHRIAIITDSATEVSEVTRPDKLRSLGSTTANYPDRDGAHHHQRAVVWLGGSLVNHREDLVHNVDRIRDLLLHKNRIVAQHELLELAAHDQHEAFGVLIRELVEVQLLRCDEEMYGWACPDTDSVQYRSAINRLRKKYDNPHRNRIADRELPLFRTFRNLHPFTLELRLTWELLDPAHSDAIQRTRALRWYYNTVSLVIAFVALIVSVISLYFTLRPVSPTGTPDGR